MRASNERGKRMILGTKWIKETFEKGSRMSKRELIDLIHTGQISGWIQRGASGEIPYVNQ
jgi:hypothetical protein